MAGQGSRQNVPGKTLIVMAIGLKKARLAPRISQRYGLKAWRILVFHEQIQDVSRFERSSSGDIILFIETNFPTFGKHIRRRTQQRQAIAAASRYGVRQAVASNIAAGKVGADIGGNGSARVTEHVGKGWRRRQRVEG